jgi:hypothetical protein
MESAHEENAARSDGSPGLVPEGGKSDPGGDLRFSPRPNRAHEIHWRPWDEDAFAEARAARKPVLLAISAVWCHWCHVMDETSYSDPRVIATVNERFVAVRVDNDRRPDVNRRYNMGGWPTVAFLTSRGEVLTGATYLSPDQLVHVLERVADHFAALPEAGDDGTSSGPPIAPIGPEPRRGAPRIARDAELDPDAAAGITSSVAALYDPLHGGFGTEPKFPQPDAVALLLAWGARHGDDRMLSMALHTLDAMAQGGLYDHVEGGFFRYATHRDWSVPHYEKMLEDNARLALLYLDAFAVTGRAACADVAGGVLDYLVSTLKASDAPVFWGSQDADEHYYTLDAAARGLIDLKPTVDRTSFVDWNALAARAMLRAATLLERPDLQGAAHATIDHLWERGHGRGGMAHYLGGPIAGLLGDQAHMTTALLDVYEASGERTYLARAVLLADWMLENLRARDGRFVDRRPALPGDQPSAHGEPIPVLDGGAEAAEALTRLAAFAGSPGYREAAATALAAYSADAAAAGVYAAAYARAVMRFTEHPTRIVIVGKRGDAQAGALLRAGLRIAEPLRSVQLLDPDADAEVVAREGYVHPGGPAAFICLAGVCLEPTSDPDSLAELVARSAVE